MTIENSRQAAQRLAAEARRRKSASDMTAETAETVRQQVGNISTEAGASLGSAIDPSQGYSLEPDARPNDLPKPGSAPGGVAERQVGNIFTGQGSLDMTTEAVQPPGMPLEDDHDALVGPGIGGPPHVPQSPTQSPSRPSQTPAVHPGPVKNLHPVLARLREDLGMESTRPMDVRVGKHTWTLATLTPGDLATASRLADQLAIGQVETKLVYETAIVAHAVMAIDAVPTYQVFGVEPPPGIPVQNPLRPPRAVRYLAAGKLYDFIQDEAKTQLGTKLYDAYLDKVDGSGAVQSYLDDESRKRVKFECSVEGCGHTLTMAPRYEPGTRNIMRPFCRWHAEPMTLTGEQNDSPLA